MRSASAQLSLAKAQVVFMTCVYKEAYRRRHLLKRSDSPRHVLQLELAHSRHKLRFEHGPRRNFSVC